MSVVSILVLGSVNLDIVASVSRLPVAGETVSGASLNRYPGGKGANQALAAHRLGASVSLVARVGDDDAANEALALLRREQVGLSHCSVDAAAATGVALISVAPGGENHIVVAPGANRTLAPELLVLQKAQGLICQLEVPVPTVVRAVAEFDGFVCVNLAPAMEVPEELLAHADLIVVNETESAFYGPVLDNVEAMVATTLGADGAELKLRGHTLAKARPPAVKVVDTTGAGDTFTAALTLALLEKQPPRQALQFACAAGALATTVAGAQPSLPTRETVDAALR
jgi:ribokinase